MSEIGEALGTAVEGGLFARAVSGDAGKVPAGRTPLDKGHFAENACLNCGTQLIGSHCHSCGQQAHLHRTMGAFLHDLLHGALHFDGKTWRTLPKLLFKPGELTRRYIEGERVRFVSPMALFLFSIFLMFAVFQIAGISTPTDLGAGSTVQVKSSIDQVKVEAEDELAAAKAELEAMSPDEAGYAQAQEKVADLEITAKALETTEAFAFGREIGKAAKAGTGVSFIDKALEKWRTNPGLMLYKLQTNFYKFSWLLIPLSIPFVWLMFAWKRQFKAYDHATFVTYSLCFMTLFILAITLGGLVGASATLLLFASLLIPPIHLYKHLRGTYGLSRFPALWRLAVLTVFIVIVLALFLQLLLVLGAF